jgi:hypothetical protein
MTGGTQLNIAGDGEIFTAKPQQLAELLKGIDSHRVALPDFQRPWVWEPQMVFDLIISVAYRYPAGSLLTMPVNDSGFALRFFEGSGENPKDKPQLMVLDGQQRLTSLYQAMFSRDGAFHKGRRYHFYLDVPVLMPDEDGCIHTGDPCFDRALFFVTEDKKSGRQVRYENLQPKYEITTPEQRLQEGALPVWSIFDPAWLAEWQKQYLVGLSDKDMDRYLELDGRWKGLVQPWVDRIRTYPFPVVELSADMPLGAICHIFEKVNSTGVPLDVFDLCNAILWAQGFLLNRKWDELKRTKLQAMFPMQDLEGTHFLMGLSLLDTIQAKMQNPNTGVGVMCRKQDLMKMGRGVVEKWWDILADGYVEAAKFMSEQGIIAQRILPYTTLIIPLAAVLAYLKWKKGPAHVGPAWNKISQWYWCSVFTQRYSSQVEYGAAQDFEQLIGWLNDGPEPTVVQTFNFRSDYLQEITSLRNVIYKGILCLLAREGAKDFGGGGKLTTDLFFDTSQDHHHIFPTDALKTLGVQDPRAESIINKTLISSATNRRIGGRLPSQYCDALARTIDATDPSLFDGILSSHAISAVALRDDDWQAFVADRRERLRALIETACGKPTQPFAKAIGDLDVETPDDA